MDAVVCEDIIYSEEYGDYIIETTAQPETVAELFDADCVQPINEQSVVVYRELPGNPAAFYNVYGYSAMPKCYGLMDTTNMEAAGVLALRRQPYISLYGSGVLIGLVDTGIDYRQPAFIAGDGTSRIVAIWDQTLQQGTMPSGFQYGSEYRTDSINAALQSEDAYSVVPSVDELGHGTFLAGIAAGNEEPANDFTGVAPLSELVVVKLKPAKSNIRQYYGIAENLPVYQENDIMLGIRYLQRIAAEENKPLVILTGVGTNAGNHAGELPLCRYLRRIAGLSGTAVVCSAGNEGNREHHYQREGLEPDGIDVVEFNVAEGESGLTLELWARAPQLFTLGIRTPLGSETGILPIWYGRSNMPITFPLENSRVFVEYTAVESYTGDEVIVVRILNPTPGIWRMEVENNSEYTAGFQIWMPIEGFLQAETRFLSPEPDTTICEPGNTREVMTVTAYNHVDNSIYINASRGYNSEGIIKPELSAPGVNIYGISGGTDFVRRSGTSIAAAHCAGVAALMLEWGIVRGNNVGMQTTDIVNTLIRGADRTEGEYPNRVWGYGRINAYAAFLQLRP